jgi:hypothetical protein
MLAQQAQDVVQAIQEISGGDDAQGRGREGAGSGSDTSKSGGQGKDQ